ncbi:MAG TPA: 50S ribosomal protein L11 methyltransferase [Longimicrobium sp.]|nr:50S ribosomal protein L11 methyltransferase [Longimicrobium sp.]
MTRTYSVSGYGWMVADDLRRSAYCRALDAAVRPGAVVLDLGTGTGFFAAYAARLGARRVIGVDPSDAIRIAREMARDNGVDDRVELIQALSTRVTLRERADVIVFDVRGVLPPLEQGIANIVDARERLLAPGGVLIPNTDVLFAAPIEGAEAWAHAAGPAEAHGVRLDAARRAALSLWTRDVFAREALLAPAVEWARMDYRTITHPDVSGAPEWTVEREGTAHGLAVWFRAELGGGAWFDTGPGYDTLYQTAFWPWPHPVRLAPGDRVRAELSARLVGGDYIWSWNTEIVRGGEPPLAFRQSTFHGIVPSPTRLRKRHDGFRATLGDEGRIDAYVLGRMDGSATLGEIARELQARFPERFATWEAALAHAGRLADQYAE